MYYYGLSGKEYHLNQATYKGGGEGNVYDIIGMNDKCAKIYHSGIETKETEEKLKVMVRRPPNESVLSQIAWPLDLLYTKQGVFSGFLMSKIDASDDLQGVYVYPPVKYKNLAFNQKLIIAQNICAVISGVHDTGFVFGDFNPRNIGVNMKTGKVAFWDTDSYHIKDPQTGKVYRCKVCMNGYVAPELLKKCKQINPDTGKSYNYENAPLDTFTQETDLFALGIHIFKLLMNGYSPFGGVPENVPLNSSILPGVGNVAIEKDQYCFTPGYTYIKSASVPDKSILPSEVLRLFDMTFIDGKTNPKKRPTARQWHEVLLKYENNLEQCKIKPVHQYKIGLKQCPWCELEKRFQQGMKSAANIQKNRMPAPVVPPGYPVGNINHRHTAANVKNKKNGKRIVLYGILLILLFYIVDAVLIYQKMRPKYFDKEQFYFIRSAESDGTADTFFIVDGLGDTNNKIYRFDYEGTKKVPMRVRTDVNTFLNVRIMDSSGNEVFSREITCEKGREQKIDIELKQGRYTLEVSSRDKYINYTIGFIYIL